MTHYLLPDGISIAHPGCAFIGGDWRPVGGKIEVISPNTEVVIAEVGEATPADVDAAVDAARAAFDDGPWPRTSPAQRAEIIRAIGDNLRAREPELARAWTAQMGALASFAPRMMTAGTDHFYNTAKLVEHFAFEELVPTTVAAAAVITREPVGVVAAIAPWNAPYSIMAAKVAPALLAGCTVIMKPAPETPLEAYIIAEAAEAAGLPPGVLNLVCAHREGSDRLVRNPLVDKVSFTGSTAVGRQIASICGERIARCTLELGGKSAAIVLDDFPTEQAAKMLTSTITTLTGQICSILSRAIVPAHRHDELAEAIAAEMQRIRVGYSDDPETQMGPLAMQRQRDRVEQLVHGARQEGTKLVTGGGRPGHLDRGFFFEPTLFANVDNRSTIAQEEIFGPVLTLIPCVDTEDAIRIANDSQYGLNGSVLTLDADAAYQVGRRIRAGGTAQNGQRGDMTLPFGGFKQSGIGRERGVEGLMTYLETKSILLDAIPTSLQR